LGVRLGEGLVRQVRSSGEFHGLRGSDDGGGGSNGEESERE
jgi:hypothetical protein